MAGAQWLNRDPFDIANWKMGLTYSVLILTFLTCHEFGHYFAAKFHKVRVTLPFYIPFPLILNPFGTMGAVIRIKEQIKTRNALFDIGIAGPVAGFAASFLMLVYGFTHLPPFEYIYSIHPEYLATGGVPTTGFSFGPNLLYMGLAELLAGPSDVFIPPMNEMYHYPFLCVGWFGLFVTALNLLPVGQLDGGHIIYALFKGKHKYIARAFFGITLGMGLTGLLPFFGIYILAEYGLVNWLVWAVLMFFVIKIDHPPFYYPEPIGPGRKLWGLFGLFMFLTSFTPVPFSGL